MRALVAAALVTLVAGPATAQSAHQAQQQTKMQHEVVRPDQVKWQKSAPPGLPSGAESALLAGDPSQPGPFIIRLRVPDGYVIRPHHHSHDEHVTVLSGHFAMGSGDRFDPAAAQELTAGGFASMPAGMHHFAVARGETVIQVDAGGPWDIIYVNPSDDPRQKRSKR
jgi:quercetin dioxygenase-like cupin family protein